MLVLSARLECSSKDYHRLVMTLRLPVYHKELSLCWSELFEGELFLGWVALLLVVFLAIAISLGEVRIFVA